MSNPGPSGDEQAKNDAPRILFEEYFNAEKAGDITRQEAVMEKIWQYVAESQSAGPSPWLQALNLAERCETAFDWPGAEAAYRIALRVAADNPGLQASAYDHLRKLFSLLNQPAKALDAARSATLAAREAKLSPLLSMMLLSEGLGHLQQGNFEHASAALCEAFTVAGDTPSHTLALAKALMLRAEYNLRQHDFAAVENDLAAAWPLLEPHSKALFAAGWQSALSGWWSISARLRAQQGNLADATAAWAEAIARDRIVAELPQLEGPYKHNWLAVDLHKWGLLLAQAHAPSAQEKFEESDSLRRRIGLPPLKR